MPYPNDELGLKQRREISRNSLHHVDSILKRWHDKQRPRLTLEDYLKGKVEMHIHYVLRVSDCESRKFCAVLKLLKGDMDHAVKDYISIFDCVSFDAYAIRNGNGGQKKLMFVSDVKIVKETENIIANTSNIIERLQPLDHCECFISDPILEFNNSAVKGPSVFENREDHSGGVALDARRVMAFNQSKEQMVKGCSCVVEAISNNQRPSDNVGIGVDFDSKDELSGITIRSLDDGIGFTLSTKGGDSRFEGIKVFLCPSNFSDIADRDSYCLSP